MDPRRLFKLGSVACLLALAGAFVLAARPCLGDQIVAVKDRNGNIIYINTGTPGRGFARLAGGFGRSADPAQLQEINSIVDQVSSKENVDPELIRSIIAVESDYDPHAVSSKGAMGLMQLMPGTAQELGVTNPFDIRQNIRGGVSYLKYLLNEFGGDLRLSLAAYNAGQHAVEHSHGVPRIVETQNYVRKVTRLYRPGESPAGNSKAAQNDPPPAPIYQYVDAQGVVHFTNTQ
jgi:Transglycosylase SLT domain/Domain of unknown function (DUF4124)